MIYADSSALLKLVHDERESAALRGWLADQESRRIVSSELASVEVCRAARRVDHRLLPAARELLETIPLIPMGGDIMVAAQTVDGPSLRSLDAIHLASALSVKTYLDAFVAYDDRLHEAALDAGLPAVQPGR